MNGPQLLVVLPGNNYRESMYDPFKSYLRQHNVYLFVIQLIENRKQTVTDSEVTPTNYTTYIQQQLDRSELVRKFNYKFILYGISMGTYHAVNYVAAHPANVTKLILVEPTFCGGHYELLKQFEISRGNEDWLDKLAGDDDEGFAANEDVIQDALSRSKRKIPRNTPTRVILSTQDADGKPYDTRQKEAKNAYIDIIRKQTNDFRVITIPGKHCLDLEPRHFVQLLRVILN